MRNCSSFIFCSILFFGFSICQAQKLIQLTDNQEYNRIDIKISYLVDSTNQLKIEDISHFNKQLNKFKNTDKTLVREWSAPVFYNYWVKIEIDNQSQSQDWVLVVENYEMGIVDFYYSSNKGKWFRIPGGTLIPFKERIIPYRYPTFPLKNLKLGKNTYFLKLRNIYESVFNATLSIQSQKRFNEFKSKDELILGFYYGYVFICVIFLTLLGIFLRQAMYICLAGMVLSSGCFVFIEYGHLYYFITKTAFIMKMHGVNNSGILGLATSLFAFYYLDVKKYSTLCLTILYLLFAFGIFSIIFLSITPLEIQYPYFWLFWYINFDIQRYIMMFIGLWVWYKGNKDAIYFVLSMFIVKYFVESPLFYQTIYGMFHAFIFREMFLIIPLLYITAIRQGRLQRERKQAILDKQKAQAETIQVQEEAYAFLEEKVKNRTEELAISNQNLEKNNRQLTSSNELIDLLFSELNHRVLNNLQVVSLLLRAEKRKAEKKDNPINLEKIESRIGELANVHRLLMYGKNRQSIVDVAEYLSNITEVLTKLYQEESQMVKINIDTQDLHLPLNQAYFLGFIVYELFSNSLKYAYQEVNEPEFCIQIQQINQAIELQIADNGKGMPAELWENGKLKAEMLQTLGLKIVSSITQIYQGYFRIEKNPQQAGVCFRIGLSFA